SDALVDVARDPVAAPVDEQADVPARVVEAFGERVHAPPEGLQGLQASHRSEGFDVPDSDGVAGGDVEDAVLEVASDAAGLAAHDSRQVAAGGAGGGGD